MIRGAIIIFLVNYCTFLFSQEGYFTREFEARKKNIPVEILNNHSSYFYVLRINTAVHDITIERRSKPGAEMLAFTPLKLDSVNAGWFDYENLDYVAFEKRHKLYFLFEKVLNSKRTLYLKVIDTLGKASGFTELASLEGDKYTAEFYFDCRVTENKDILIIATRVGFTGIKRRVAMLFSTTKREMIWTKRLPLENESTISSWYFTCNKTNDLLYFQTYSSILGYETFGGMTQSIIRLDSLLFWSWAANATAPVASWLDIEEMTSIRTGFILPDTAGVFLSVQGLEEDTLTGDQKELIVNIKLKALSGDQEYMTKTYYDESIRDQLTFYDGTNNKASWYKMHALPDNYKTGSYLYTLSERTEPEPFSKQDYYKELLFRKTDLRDGRIVTHKIIPRKIFFFRNRTRFKNIGNVMISMFKDSLKLLVLENPSNFKKDPNVFNNREFKKETNLWNSNIVSYSLRPDGRLEKKLVFKNGEFDMVPVNYSSNGQRDIILYLNNSRFEKFAILNLYPF